MVMLMQALQSSRSIVWYLRVDDLPGVTDEGWKCLLDFLQGTNVCKFFGDERLKDQVMPILRRNQMKHDLHSSAKNKTMIETVKVCFGRLPQVDSKDDFVLRSMVEEVREINDQTVVNNIIKSRTRVLLVLPSHKNEVIMNLKQIRRDLENLMWTIQVKHEEDWIDWVQVQKSRIQGAGRGLFALRDFSEGKPIGVYCGDEVAL